MSRKQNIEDIFKSGLEDFSVKPNAKVWTGINKQMIGPRLESLYRNTFNGFRMSPSEQVWRRVAAAVWFNKFIHFTPFSFNVYYAGLIITAVVGTIVTVNNTPDLNFVRFDKNNREVIVVDDNSPAENFSKIEIPDLLAKTQIVKIDNTDGADNINEYFPRNTQTQNIQTIEENSEIDKLDDVEVVTSQSIIEPENQQVNSTNLSQEKNINLEKPNITNIYTQAFTRADLFKLKNVKYSPLWFEIADNVFKNQVALPENIHDTIAYNYLNEPIIRQSKYFSVELFATPYLHNYAITLNNPELQANFDRYKANIDPCLSYAFGLGLAYNYNNVRFETGISYFRLNEDYTHNYQDIDTLISYSTEYFINETMVNDTIWVLDLDEYLQGNTVYRPYINQNLVYELDSIVTSNVDTVLVDKTIQIQSRYNIIDIPLLGGYEFTFDRFSITPKAGVILGAMILRTGNCLNVADGQIHQASQVPNASMLFDYYVATNLQYKVGKSISFFAEPHLRGNIGTMHQKTYPIAQKGFRYGIKTGISLRF